MMLGWLGNGASKAASVVLYGLTLLRGLVTRNADVSAGRPTEGGDALFTLFPNVNHADIPLGTHGRAPLTSVVTLVFKQTVITYPGDGSAEAHEGMGFGTGFIVEGSPTQIVTAAHNLWSVDPTNAAGRVYTEYCTTEIMAVAYDRFEILDDALRDDFEALRQQAGGQYVRVFQTPWPFLDELSQRRVVEMSPKQDSLDIALLHVLDPITQGPHLRLFRAPVRVQDSLPGMSAVTFGHTRLLDVQPSYYAFPIPLDGIDFSEESFDLPIACGTPGFSGGPLCIPPEATVSGRGLLAAEAQVPADARAAWRVGAMHLGGTDPGLGLINPVRRFRRVDQKTLTFVSASKMKNVRDLKAYAEQFRILPPSTGDPYQQGTRKYYQTFRKLDSRGPTVCWHPMFLPHASRSPAQMDSLARPASIRSGGQDDVETSEGSMLEVLARLGRVVPVSHYGFPLDPAARRLRIVSRRNRT